MRRVAITGIGAVTPVGNDADATWSALRAGRSGVGPITSFDVSTFAVRIAGMVKNFDAEVAIPDAALRRNLSRPGAFGVAAALEALADAGLSGGGDYRPGERGVSVGATAGRPSLAEMAEIFHRLRESLPLYQQPVEHVLERDQNTPAAAIARAGGCAGPMVGVSTACTASGHALGEAYRLIQEGEARMMVAGGYDSLISWLDVLGFSLLGALTTEHADEPERASRPFSADRSGFVLGEGAVMFVLEDLESARQRGAHIHAEIVGYAATMNAYRMTDPPPDGGGVSLAMAHALDDAGLQPSDIGYIAAHGTSTPGNDICETRAIKDVFGEHADRVAISSVKSMIGHITAAAAAAGLLGALGVLRTGYAPPTINLDRPDPALNLDYVAGVAKPVETDAVMVNAFAFGGTNACLILRRETP
ncbi:beta-ketoacyl-[acyl-carrier-protein] synthase family protein [Micromonospora sp. NPDC049204]|uniref:beta-ketoacyl-[acyl-carrier-protein] synthase family protein n=1 Tax=unclassified Micromonospora TaxID=2617518 RepID=UPI0034037DD8